MKKQSLFRNAVVAAVIVFSMGFAAVVFAADVSHTISIVNNSNVPLKPSNNPHVVVFNSNDTCTASGGAAACGEVNMTIPNSIPAKSSGVVTMKGPAGCNISAWQTFYTPSLKGKQGTIRCQKSPVNVCNSITKNYTCTVTQTNVDLIKGTNNSTDASSVQ